MRHTAMMASGTSRSGGQCTSVLLGSKAASSASSGPPSTPKTKADMFQQHQLKHYKGMVECKVCHTRHKSVILTRCFHLFCRECIDTAMATRQRRCPTCGVPIGKADIHDIFWD